MDDLRSAVEEVVNALDSHAELAPTRGCAAAAGVDVDA